MDIWQTLMTPFSWILKLFCQVFNSYGIALFFFTVVIKLILFPLSLKGKRSMIKMSVVNSQLQEIRERCGKDRERYNIEVQKFYAENHVNPMGGCGWSLLPIVFLYPLYAIIRRPLKYMMWLSESAVEAVANALNWTGVRGSAFTAGGYNELILGSMMNAGNLETAKAAVGASAASVFVINFNFFGIDLSQIPTLMFWNSDKWASGDYWGAIGLFLLPMISAGLSIVSMFVTQKTNQMNKDQKVKISLSMILLGPLISLWIGFAMPAGLCIYWISNSLLIMVQEVICGKMLRKDYEAAQKEMEEQQRKAKEAEKERRRKAAEKKAAAIAAGKSKKAQPKKRGAEVAASREGLRAYARGRAYDPNRYPITPYYDPNGPAKVKPAEEEESKALTEEEKQILADSNPELAAKAAEAEKAAKAEQAAEAPETSESEDGDYEEAYSEDEEQEQTPDDKE